MEWCYPEFGRLRRVLMHAPGKELDLISPASYKRMLFEDAIDRAEFQRQHANFATVLRSEGVEVLLLTEILREKPDVLKTVEKHPNLVFTRDLAFATRSGYVLTRMKSHVRRDEPELVDAALQQLDLKRLMRTEAPATIEGGDVAFLDEETLLVGVGNRTNRNGFRQLNSAATRSGLCTMVAVRMPPWAIHLDGTMMVVDRDLAIVHRRSLNSPALIYEGGKLVKRIRMLEFLKSRGMRLVEVTDYERQRRATNVIALGPREIIGYAGNSRVRKELANNGVDFIEIEGSELIRGAGGPRCVTVPIMRD